jgi:hypothetical protein
LSESLIFIPNNIDLFIKYFDVIIENKTNPTMIKKIIFEIDIVIFKTFNFSYEEVGLISPKIVETFSESDFNNFKIS